MGVKHFFVVYTILLFVGVETEGEGETRVESKPSASQRLSAGERDERDSGSNEERKRGRTKGKGASEGRHSPRQVWSLLNFVRSWCDGSSDRSFMGWTH